MLATHRGALLPLHQQIMARTVSSTRSPLRLQRSQVRGVGWGTAPEEREGGRVEGCMSRGKGDREAKGRCTQLEKSDSEARSRGDDSEERGREGLRRREEGMGFARRDGGRWAVRSRHACVSPVRMSQQPPAFTTRRIPASTLHPRGLPVPRLKFDPDRDFMYPPDYNQIPDSRLGTVNAGKRLFVTPLCSSHSARPGESAGARKERELERRVLFSASMSLNSSDHFLQNTHADSEDGSQLSSCGCASEASLSVFTRTV